MLYASITLKVEKEIFRGDFDKLSYKNKLTTRFNPLSVWLVLKTITQDMI